MPGFLAAETVWPAMRITELRVLEEERILEERPQV